MTDPIKTYLQPAPVFKTVLGIGQGPAGPAGASGTATSPYNLAYGDASPALVVHLNSGTTVYGVNVIVTEAFNGAGATLSVGTSTNHNLLVNSSFLDLQLVTTFEFVPQELFVSAGDVYVFITPGSGATTGKASIILQRQ